MNTEFLKLKLLEAAIQGKLVPQDPNDEPASIMLARIRKERNLLIKERKWQVSKPEKSALKTIAKKAFDIPQNWEWCCLVDTCRVFGRIGFRGYKTSDLVKKKEEGAISISPSNIKNGEMDFNACTYISDVKYKESPEIMVSNGDLLIVKTGS